ncbi:MAG: DNA repair protein RecN [Clostridia bacterium]|nr:DNA repair protein RecN [Clostridia bacterium]
MLSALYIENLAIIERVEMSFEAGFNVLTGETGAGKSIIIDALGAVLGERTSRDLVRTGCSEALVTATFTELSAPVLAELREQGFETDEDGSLLITRRIGADGKTTCRIGGRPASVSVLREIGRRLVNIHGQHENQTLLSVDRHRGYLDALGRLQPFCDAYAETYHRYCDIRRELKKLDMDEDAKARRMDLLKFQIDELEAADLKVGEEDSLKKRRDVFRGSEKITAALRRAQSAYMGDDDHDGVSALLTNVTEGLQAAAGLMDDLQPLYERVQSLCYELDACGDELRDAAENLTFDEAERDAVEDRLAHLRRVLSKYGGTEEAALSMLADFRTELDGIVTSDARIVQLNSELAAAQDVMVAAAEKLTAARRRAAEQFAARVQEELQFLDMPRVTLAVSIEPTALTVNGADKVEFLISSNPGEPPRSIAKIASGGELSRVMLAMKSVMADTDEIDTLIFDEIDTGISGHAAQRVGIKLRSAAVSNTRSRQILCVTHLAQIASQADSHLLIRKEVVNERTFTRVDGLDRDGRERELARIVSGSVTDASLTAAREMLNLRQK